MASLDAFLAPPPGDWRFYVTIDLHSGETRYAVSNEPHQANLELLQDWLSDDPTSSVSFAGSSGIRVAAADNDPLEPLNMFRYGRGRRDYVLPGFGM